MGCGFLGRPLKLRCCLSYSATLFSLVEGVFFIVTQTSLSVIVSPSLLCIALKLQTGEGLSSTQSGILCLTFMGLSFSSPTHPGPFSSLYLFSVQALSILEGSVGSVDTLRLVKQLVSLQQGISHDKAVFWL